MSASARATRPTGRARARLPPDDTAPARMTGAPASPFEANRSYLTRLAYRMLGSLSDAEDVVQDAWLRWHETAPEAIANPRAWLGRVVTRLCLDLMKSARRKRETYVGAWLPEPLIEAIGGGYLSAAYKDVFGFGALVLILAIRPTGLFGKEIKGR